MARLQIPQLRPSFQAARHPRGLCSNRGSRGPDTSVGDPARRSEKARVRSSGHRRVGHGTATSPASQRCRCPRSQGEVERLPPVLFTGPDLPRCNLRTGRGPATRRRAPGGRLRLQAATAQAAAVGSVTRRSAHSTQSGRVVQCVAVATSAGPGRLSSDACHL
ncbi:hypothetical protein NDU88_008358 [Pleurodeles waltl]|uniref:Uncharacterized protein n=1 Tax=Pleurodeles waltl TaxID=8319 RepID=A0AAV7RWM5_PLEWA|nr:hypothetical protein NDU88_008358 [Pleurodeles waltl]